MFVDIQVDVKWTPPLAQDLMVSVQAGDTKYFSLNGTDSRGSPTPLGYFYSVGGFRQVFQNNTYQLGSVSLEVRRMNTHRPADVSPPSPKAGGRFEARFTDVVDIEIACGFHRFSFTTSPNRPLNRRTLCVARTVTRVDSITHPGFGKRDEMVGCARSRELKSVPLARENSFQN